MLQFVTFTQLVVLRHFIRLSGKQCHEAFTAGLRYNITQFPSLSPLTEYPPMDLKITSLISPGIGTAEKKAAGPVNKGFLQRVSGFAAQNGLLDQDTIVKLYGKKGKGFPVQEAEVFYTVKQGQHRGKIAYMHVKGITEKFIQNIPKSIGNKAERFAVGISQLAKQHQAASFAAPVGSGLMKGLFTLGALAFTGFAVYRLVTAPLRMVKRFFGGGSK